MPQGARNRQRQSPRPADRQRELLDIARQLLMEGDSAELTVERVAEASGIAKGTFYLYFDSKDHLLARLWADNLETFVNSMQTIFNGSSSSPDGSTVPDTLIEQMIRYDVANAAIHRAVLFRASQDSLGLLHGTDAKVIDMLAGAIHAAGAAEMAQSETAAALLYYGVDGLLNFAHRSHSKPDVDAIIAAAREMVRRTLHTA